MEKIEKPVVDKTAEKTVRKLDNKYDDHVEIRFHKAKKAIFPQLDAVIKINLNLNDMCNDLCTKYRIGDTSFKQWVQEQIPSIIAVEEDDDIEDVEEKEAGE